MLFQQSTVVYTQCQQSAVVFCYNMSSSNEDLTLRELITRAGFTQRSLSKVSGIPERTINTWVEGVYKPSDINRLILLSRTLGVSLLTLLKSFGYSVDDLSGD